MTKINSYLPVIVKMQFYRGECVLFCSKFEVKSRSYNTVLESTLTDDAI